MYGIRDVAPLSKETTPFPDSGLVRIGNNGYNRLVYKISSYNQYVLVFDDRYTNFSNPILVSSTSRTNDTSVFVRTFGGFLAPTITIVVQEWTTICIKTLFIDLKLSGVMQMMRIQYLSQAYLQVERLEWMMATRFQHYMSKHQAFYN